jgi:uncharacterized protein YutE (UPF0331/DUF86 family)
LAFHRTTQSTYTTRGNFIMINGVIAQKLQSLDAVLVELRSLGQITAQHLDQDWRTKKAVERNLQISVEVVIDVCQRLLSMAGQTPATTGRDAVDRAIHSGFISQNDAYYKMVQFRNFMVHRCEHVGNAILTGMVNQRLADFEQFRDEVMTYVRKTSDVK